MKSDVVGVVVIGRNEGERLVECLSSVRTVTENIVYVDSGSTDDSTAAAKEIGALVVMLDLSRPFTAARARNEGFATLRRLRPNVSYVQFVDGDCILSPDWINKALAFLEQRDDVAIACGRRRERHPAASIYNQLCDLEWDTPVGEAAACGGDALVRVTAFEEVGGFLPQIMAGEEPELCVRLRERSWRIFRLDAEMTLHDAAMTRFSQWWVRSVRSGYGMAEVTRLHRNSPFRLWPRAVPSTLFWACLLPATVALGCLIHPLFLFLAVIYPLQACRIAIRSGGSGPIAWANAVIVLVSKFAQLQGLLKFYWVRSRGQTAQLIEYKE
jgi:GT2 family glycosyltransferase